MSSRLADLYQPGDWVEVFFQEAALPVDRGLFDSAWHPAQVVEAQHPGIWVRVEDGSLWFVTNTRRIRSLQRHEPDSE